MQLLGLYVIAQQSMQNADLRSESIRPFAVNQSSSGSLIEELSHTRDSYPVGAKSINLLVLLRSYTSQENIDL